MDSSEHSERYDAVSYPATFPREQLMEAICSWDGPSGDERIGKARLSAIVNVYSDCLGYNLIDFDDNGVPELFFYKEADCGDYGYITVCDIKTQQTSIQYVSAYDVGDIAGTGMVCNT